VASCRLRLGDIGLDPADFPKIAAAVRGIMQVFMGDFPETEWVGEDPGEADGDG
jgi:hypothetical protein